MQKDSVRITTVWNILTTQYPHAHMMLTFSNPWELLVAVILSAQCTDVRVNIVTKTLFAKYKTLTDYITADGKEFEQDIKSTGFYHAKAAHILNAARIVQNRFHGKIPSTMADLLTLPCVARKTANVVLFNAYHKNEGIAVDTHVLRLSERLKLVPAYAFKNPLKTERELMKIFPVSEWGNSTYRLIEHGRAVCQAKKPKCSSCLLQNVCPSAFLV